MTGGDECSCRRGCYPNGQGLIIPGVLSCIAWLLCITTLALCDLFETGEYRKKGLFQYKDSDDWCEDFSDSFTEQNIDAAWKTARASGVIALVLGFITMTMVLTAGCMAFKLIWYNIMGVMFFLCFIFQGLVFLVLASDYCSGGYCDLDPVSGVPITACIFWLASMISVMVTAKPVPTAENVPGVLPAPAVAGTVTSTTTSAAPAIVPVAQPGQSVVKKTTVINPDGSKTVTVESVPAQYNL